jgi:hypothetical protein
MIGSFMVCSRTLFTSGRWFHLSRCDAKEKCSREQVL